MDHRIARILASVALLLALAVAWSASGLRMQASSVAAPAYTPPLSLLDTFTLLRWGQGALDWTLPDAKEPKGESHARIPEHRA